MNEQEYGSALAEAMITLVYTGKADVTPTQHISLDTLVRVLGTAMASIFASQAITFKDKETKMLLAKAFTSEFNVHYFRFMEQQDLV